VSFSSAAITIAVGHLLLVTVSFDHMQQCIPHGSLMLMRRTFAADDHRNITVAADLSAATSAYRGDLPS
jgi:hypothetical protein